MFHLSIITINYNNKAGLELTVKSVQNQQSSNYEHIIIDGGSTDGSKDVILENKHSFSYWVSEPDSGIYNAMNKGIKVAKGTYLLFLNSGDHFYKDNVLKQYSKYIIDKDIIYFNLNVVDSKEAYIKTYPNVLSFSYFTKDTLPHPATFINKEVFKKTSLYYEQFKIVSDWKFFIDAICKYNASYIQIDETLSTFYFDGGISSNPANKKIRQSERKQVLENEYRSYFQDVKDVLFYKSIVDNLRKSRIIKLLVRLGFLHKF
ncbi:hypothetical protein A8C32_00775 [Flavivirga aquatica]|uniref:Glycosyltransferase 2-like domain-containing protein n=1 Tax=Flavivirga aquatica TaxID=1849968 RepID=A0A1E5TBU2_9FLAO|nr:glycosyltransferase family 2 protein [Flavivirga aquatica]OEK08842.1 hypothetical protein A8C32_00775 [Flavivirga aquatica]